MGFPWDSHGNGNPIPMHISSQLSRVSSLGRTSCDVIALRQLWNFLRHDLTCDLLCAASQRDHPPPRRGLWLSGDPFREEAHPLVSNPRSTVLECIQAASTVRWSSRSNLLTTLFEKMPADISDAPSIPKFRTVIPGDFLAFIQHTQFINSNTR